MLRPLLPFLIDVVGHDETECAGKPPLIVFILTRCYRAQRIGARDFMVG
jgi:hypothetical protein